MLIFDIIGRRTIRLALPLEAMSRSHLPIDRRVGAHLGRADANREFKSADLVLLCTLAEVILIHPILPGQQAFDDKEVPERGHEVRWTF